MRKFLAAAALMAGIFLTGGCMEKENRFVSYMEKRYGETFTYKESERGSVRESGYTVSLLCERFPGEEILVTQIKEEDGSFSYLDNYMAYVLHEEAKRRIEDAAGCVFKDFWVYFPVPRGVFDSGTGEYGVEAYLQEEGASRMITVLVFGEDASDESLDALIDAFVRENIVLQCTLVFVKAETDPQTVTPENLADYMAKSGWYEKIADFWVRKDGKTGYRSWRQQ